MICLKEVVLSIVKVLFHGPLPPYVHAFTIHFTVFMLIIFKIHKLHPPQFLPSLLGCIGNGYHGDDMHVL